MLDHKYSNIDKLFLIATDDKKPKVRIDIISIDIRFIIKLL